VTRPDAKSRGVAALFARDPCAAVARVVREADRGLTAAEIKETLRRAGVPALDRSAWGRLQKALRVDDHVVVEPGFRYRWVVESPETAARQRQAVLDGLRALAELAGEVEELAVNQASTRAMVHRVRSRVKLSGLEPIERASDTVTFDRRRHQPIGPAINDGAAVVVVRPGYAWKTAAEDVLVARAVVQE
jgi:hypothetical protein